MNTSKERAVRQVVEIRDDSTLRHRILLQATVRARWLCLCTVIMLTSINTMAIYMIIILASILILANVLLLKLISIEDPTDTLVSLTRVSSVFLDVAVAIAVPLVLFGDPSQLALSTIPILLMSSGMHFGFGGLAVGSLSSIGLMSISWYRHEPFVYDVSGFDYFVRIFLCISIFGQVIIFMAVMLAVYSRIKSLDVFRMHEMNVSIRRLECGLSFRETGILQLLANEDFSYDHISGLLNISTSTVKTHVRHIGQKIGARGRSDVLKVAQEKELLSFPEYGNDAYINL